MVPFCVLYNKYIIKSRLLNFNALFTLTKELFVNRQKYTLAFLRFVKYRHCQFCPTPPLVRSSPRGKISSRQNWGKNFIMEPPCIIQSGQQYKIQKLCNSLIMEAPWPGAAVDRCFDIFIISSRPRSLERDDICKVTTKKEIQHFSENSCKWKALFLFSAQHYHYCAAVYELKVRRILQLALL